MAAYWEWETVLLWSERVFSMINDGRLKDGWADRYAIKDVQRDIFAVGARLNAKKPDKRSEQNNQPNWFFREFNEDLEGKPCSIWNNGESCGFNTSHGSLPNRLCHCCNWCANKFRKLNWHREVDCNKKIKERKFLYSKHEQKQSNVKEVSNNQDFAI